MDARTCKRLAPRFLRRIASAVFSLSPDEAARGDDALLRQPRPGAGPGCAMHGIPAYIVMPRNAPAVKQAAVAGYGGIITSASRRWPHVNRRWPKSWP